MAKNEYGVKLDILKITKSFSPREGTRQQHEQKLCMTILDSGPRME